jgi:flavodoxin
MLSPALAFLAVAAALGTVSCASGAADATSSATTLPAAEAGPVAPARTKVLLYLVGSPYGSTAKVAGAIAEELGASIVGPERADLIESDGTVLAGFGSGVFRGEHHPALLALADGLPSGRHRKVFLFSTCGIPAILSSPERLADAARRYHASLRERLRAKGYEVVGEFGCPGFNDNRFLSVIGGLNRGRPNAEDLERARAFARGLKEQLSVP